MAAAPLTVAVHSRRRLLGEALAWCLATQPGLSVVGHTQQWAQLGSLCRLRQPEVVVVDAAADIDEAIHEMRRLTARSPVAHVVLLSDQQPGHELPADDTWRVLAHTRGLGALLAALNERYTARYDASRASSRATSRAARLTEREIEVLTMVGSGLTAPEIAHRLDIGPRSVENHKRRIYAKLGAHSQAAAVAVIAPLGILDLRPETRPVSPPELSQRETQILRLSSCGFSVRQMANTLGVAPKTVEAQLSLLYRKLNVHNRAAALTVARAQGLIPEPRDIP